MDYSRGASSNPSIALSSACSVINQDDSSEPDEEEELERMALEGHPLIQAKIEAEPKKRRKKKVKVNEDEEMKQPEETTIGGICEAVSTFSLVWAVRLVLLLCMIILCLVSPFLGDLSLVVATYSVTLVLLLYCIRSWNKRERIHKSSLREVTPLDKLWASLLGVELQGTLAMDTRTGLPADYKIRRTTANLGRHKSLRLHQIQASTFDDTDPEVIVVNCTEDDAVSARFYTDITVNGVLDCEAIIDSGSQATTVSAYTVSQIEEKLGSRLPRVKLKHRLVAFNGHPIPVDGCVLLDLQIGSVLLKSVPCHIAPDSAQILIGSNVLLNYKTNLTHRGGKAYLKFADFPNSKEVELQLKPEEMHSARVDQSEETIILAPGEVRMVTATLNPYATVGSTSLDRKPLVVDITEEFQQAGLACEQIVHPTKGRFKVAVKNEGRAPFALMPGFEAFSAKAITGMEEEEVTDVTAVVGALGASLNVPECIWDSCICRLRESTVCMFLTDRLGFTSGMTHHLPVDREEVTPGCHIIDNSIYMVPDQKLGFAIFSDEAAQEFLKEYEEKSKNSAFKRDSIGVLIGTTAQVNSCILRFVLELRKKVDVNFVFYDERNICPDCAKSSIVELKKWPERPYTRKMRIIIPASQGIKKNSRNLQRLAGTSYGTFNYNNQIQLSILYPRPYEMSVLLHANPQQRGDNDFMRNILLSLFIDLKRLRPFAKILIQCGRKKEDLNDQVLEAIQYALEESKIVHDYALPGYNLRQWKGFDSSDLLPMETVPNCLCEVCEDKTEEAEGEAKLLRNAYAGEWPCLTAEEILDQAAKRRNIAPETEVQIFAARAMRLEEEGDSLSPWMQQDSEELENTEPHFLKEVETGETRNYGRLQREGEEATRLVQNDLTPPPGVRVRQEQTPEFSLPYAPDNFEEIDGKVIDYVDCKGIDEANVRKPMTELLEKRRKCFKITEGDFRLLRNVSLRLSILRPNEPEYHRPYVIANEKEEAFRELIEEKRRLGILVPCKSPMMTCPVFMIEKRSATAGEKTKYRLLADLRPLNARIISQKNPHVNVDVNNLYRKLGGACFKSQMDYSNAFFSLNVCSSSRPWLGISLPYREVCLSFSVLGQGQVNAPACWGEAVSHCFSPEMLKKLVIFADDIVLITPKGRTYEESVQLHLDALKQFLSELEQAGAVLQIKKSNFFCQDLQFLGYQVRGDKLELSEDRSRKIKGFSEITSLKQLQAFVGACNFVSSHIQGFAQLCRVLHQGESTKQGKFELTDVQRRAVKLLMKNIEEAPSLHILPLGAQVEAVTDASAVSTGTTWFYRNEGHINIISYSSKAFSPQEVVTLTSPGKEMAAIAHALQCCPHYAVLTPIIYSDLRTVLNICANSVLGHTASRLHNLAHYIMSYPLRFSLKWNHSSKSPAQFADYLSRYVWHPEQWSFQDKEVVNLPGQKWSLEQVPSSGIEAVQLTTEDILAFMYKAGKFPETKKMQEKTKEEFLAGIGCPVREKKRLEKNWASSVQVKELRAKRHQKEPKNGDYDDSMRMKMQHLLDQKVTSEGNIWKMDSAKILMASAMKSLSHWMKEEKINKDDPPSLKSFADAMNFDHVGSALTLAKLKKAQEEDPQMARVLKMLRAQLTNPNSKVPKRTSKRYALFNNVLLARRDTKTQGLRVCLPLKEALQVLAGLHTTGHPSQLNLAAVFRERFFVPRLMTLVKAISLSCRTCRLVRPGRVRRIPGRLQRGRHVGDIFILDHMTFPPAVKGNKVYKGGLTITDSFSRYICFLPVTTFTSKEVVEKLEQCFSILGDPTEIISDRGAGFIGQEMVTFTKERGIKLTFALPHSPESHGIVENCNQILRRMTRELVIQWKGLYTWVELIHLVQRNINQFRRTYQLVTQDNRMVEKKASASELVFGKRPNQRFDKFFSTTVDEQGMLQIREKIHEALVRYEDLKIKEQEERDAKLQERAPIKKNTWVMIQKLPQGKFGPKYHYDVFKVVEVKNRMLLVQSVFGLKKNITSVHVRFVKPFYSSELLKMLSRPLQLALGQYFDVEHQEELELPFDLQSNVEEMPKQKKEEKKKQVHIPVQRQLSWDDDDEEEESEEDKPKTPEGKKSKKIVEESDEDGSQTPPRFQSTPQRQGPVARPMTSGALRRAIMPRIARFARSLTSWSPDLTTLSGSPSSNSSETGKTIMETQRRAPKPRRLKFLDSSGAGSIDQPSILMDSELATPVPVAVPPKREAPRKRITRSMAGRVEPDEEEQLEFVDPHEEDPERSVVKRKVTKTPVRDKKKKTKGKAVEPERQLKKKEEEEELVEIPSDADEVKKKEGTAGRPKRNAKRPIRYRE